MNATKSGKGRIAGIVVAVLIAAFAMSTAGCDGKAPTTDTRQLTIQPTG